MDMNAVVSKANVMSRLAPFIKVLVAVGVIVSAYIGAWVGHAYGVLPAACTGAALAFGIGLFYGKFMFKYC